MASTNALKIGMALLELRRRAGRTQAEVGNVCSVSGMMVSYWERGLRTITKADISSIVLYCGGTQQKADELIGLV